MEGTFHAKEHPVVHNFSKYANHTTTQGCKFNSCGDELIFKEE
jgi:hypothetical protein